MRKAFALGDFVMMVSERVVKLGGLPVVLANRVVLAFIEFKVVRSLQIEFVFQECVREG